MHLLKAPEINQQYPVEGKVYVSDSSGYIHDVHPAHLIELLQEGCKQTRNTPTGPQTLDVPTITRPHHQPVFVQPPRPAPFPPVILEAAAEEAAHVESPITAAEPADSSHDDLPGVGDHQEANAGEVAQGEGSKEAEEHPETEASSAASTAEPSPSATLLVASLPLVPTRDASALITGEIGPVSTADAAKKS